VRSKSDRKPVYRAYQYRNKRDDEETERKPLLSSPESARQSDGWGCEEFLTCVSHTAHVIAIGWTSDDQTFSGIQMENPPTGAINVIGVGKKLQFPTNIPLLSLSVRHTLVLCRNGSTYRQTSCLFSLAGSPMIVVF